MENGQQVAAILSGEATLAKMGGGCGDFSHEHWAVEKNPATGGSRQSEGLEEALSTKCPRKEEVWTSKGQ